MKDVVFGGWLAYPASIAVQVTLAFLSFFLLRFIFAVKGIAVAKLSQKNHKLSFGPDYYGIFDNVISV